MKNFTPEQVVSYIVKNGWSEQKAREAVKANYDFIRKSYQDARCSQVAKMIMYYC